MPQLLDLNTNNRLLIIHPDDRLLRRYLSELIDENALLYSRFLGTELDFDSAQDIVFADYTWLGDYETLPGAYILDEVDRLSPEAFNDLLLCLIESDPLAIVMFSRTLPPGLFEDDMLLDKIQMVSDTGITAPNSADFPALEVSGFGIGRVRINGRDIQLIPGDLTHELFFYLLEHDVLSRDILLSEFWSDMDKESAVDNFHMTLKRLNQLLGLKILQLPGGHYRLNPNIAIQYDVQTFRDTLENTLMAHGESYQDAYETAYRLHHHDFLQGISSDWAIHRRNELRELQSDVCVSYAKMAIDSDTALGLYARAFHYNPYREDVADAMMTIYLDSGFPCDALTVYEALNDNIMRRNGIPPSRNLHNLMQEAKANCTP